ncbi:hypothetical protein PIB30_054754 [Stylosanthes scabra]|uniref:Uncharacterized protein n=1 Tax=Stylosanthes scabra TaxID=79078 RepID=A0ABU6UIC9_9FABA|nr:hypothetical protein [Stylosanthes scabra]
MKALKRILRQDKGADVHLAKGKAKLHELSTRSSPKPAALRARLAAASQQEAPNNSAVPAPATARRIARMSDRDGLSNTAFANLNPINISSDSEEDPEIDPEEEDLEEEDPEEKDPEEENPERRILRKKILRWIQRKRIQKKTQKGIRRRTRKKIQQKTLRMMLRTRSWKIWQRRNQMTTIWMRYILLIISNRLLDEHSTRGVATRLIWDSLIF